MQAHIPSLHTPRPWVLGQKIETFFFWKLPRFISLHYDLYDTQCEPKGWNLCSVIDTFL